ncbi:MAG: hypothetical protein A2821_01500 [Candidatus Magasanikbacteria bacterium RIFCSPHIGHO2_01_FULL_41_23]|nr:MAG: hypothetical protein A2821_01500 [Candidatus Magasanikbacteria bacterium RIFCSPHIGHO2_01_FULL_41_23]OGH66796.1 MAG: hypothetical protein A3C66_01805 [Candidatus Magasanikbacteria bacterium RIFCSPHIGHO2_02_FULL_41_35]OGH76684.1 MAG: hypothetical protein A3F22_01120 [Candidatus Magasanikbacteria bacterium RIFCSPHIGHO2_12_FULL_41_16]
MARRTNEVPIFKTDPSIGDPEIKPELHPAGLHLVTDTEESLPVFADEANEPTGSVSVDNKDQAMLREWEEKYSSLRKDYDSLEKEFSVFSDIVKSPDLQKSLDRLTDGMEDVKLSIDLISELIEYTKKDSIGTGTEDYWYGVKNKYTKAKKDIAKIIEDAKEPLLELKKLEAKRKLDERLQAQRKITRNIVKGMGLKTNETTIPPKNVIELEDSDLEEVTNTTPPPLPHEVHEVVEAVILPTSNAPDQEPKTPEWPAPLLSSIDTEKKQIILADDSQVDFDIPDLPLFNPFVMTKEDRASGPTAISRDNPNPFIFHLSLEEEKGSRGLKYGIEFSYDKRGKLTGYTQYEANGWNRKKGGALETHHEDTKVNASDDFKPSDFKVILEQFKKYVEKRIAQNKKTENSSGISTDIAVDNEEATEPDLEAQTNPDLEPQHDTVPAMDNFSTIPEQKNSKEDLEQELEAMISEAKILMKELMRKKEEIGAIDTERKMEKLREKFRKKHEEYNDASPTDAKKYKPDLYENFKDEDSDEILDAWSGSDKRSDDELENELDANPSRQPLTKEEQNKPIRAGFWGGLRNNIRKLAIVTGVLTVVGVVTNKDNKKEESKPADAGVKPAPRLVVPTYGAETEDTGGGAEDLFVNIQPQTPEPKIIVPQKIKRPQKPPLTSRRVGLRDGGKPGSQTLAPTGSTRFRRELGAGGQLEPINIRPAPEREKSRKESLQLRYDISRKTDLLFDLLPEGQYDIEDIDLLKSTLAETIFNIAQKAIFPGQKGELKIELDTAKNEARGNLPEFLAKVYKIGKKYEASTTDLEKAAKFL